MPRELHRLTPAKVQALDKPGRHSDGGGLVLQIGHGGGKSWQFRYQFAGKPRHMGLGPVDLGRLAESLATARQKSQEARERLAAGEDPLEARRVQEALQAPTKAILFEACAVEYMAAHSPHWKNAKHRQQWRNTLSTYVYPTIGKLPVQAVGIEHVKTILRPIWGTKAETARRVRGRIEAILDYATASNYRVGENSAREKPIRQVLGKSRRRQRHHASLHHSKVPGLMTKLAERDDVAARALEWIALTAVRSSEGRFAEWVEIDRDKARWLIPASRMKNGEPHEVPLSREALVVLDRLPKVASQFVFVAQGQKAISDTSLRDVLRDLGYSAADATLHGFRSSFRDWCAESGIADDVAEACLAHTVEDKTVAAYKRTKFLAARRDVMERWGACLSFG
jgi:integrase